MSFSQIIIEDNFTIEMWKSNKIFPLNTVYLMLIYH
jgi:hypothetical protein